MNNIVDLFSKPCIIAIVSDINEGKSNLVYYLIKELDKKFKYNLYTFGLKMEIENATNINSVSELEGIKDSIIFLDEVMSLWDLDNRVAKKQIERTLRLINHNNNILVISAVPENLKKFISSKINIIIYKKVTFADFINGSSVKRIILEYKGDERGTNILNLKKDEAIMFDGQHYSKIGVPYLSDFDTKKDNLKIVKKK